MRTVICNLFFLKKMEEAEFSNQNALCVCVCVCVCVSPFSTFEPLIRFLQNLAWTLFQYWISDHCTRLFPTVCKKNMVDARNYETYFALYRNDKL